MAGEHRRATLLQLSICFCVLKQILQQTVKMIWKAVLDIINRPGEYLTIMKGLASAFSLVRIQELDTYPEIMSGWFNIDLEKSTTPVCPKALDNSTVSITLTQPETPAPSQPSLGSLSNEEAIEEATVLRDWQKDKGEKRGLSKGADNDQINRPNRVKMKWLMKVTMLGVWLLSNESHISTWLTYNFNTVMFYLNIQELDLVLNMTDYFFHSLSTF